ncbi:MAG TPA: aminotransferase class V-fold PLP-dependent enzyme [Thermoanaerobaculia bacterium]|nr:aminotransferase class V-fold PLP-dependent enzyme [Thermoanaerobaculia bacterium]
MPSGRRKDFSLDEGIAYLNCAHLGPMPRVAVEATARALQLKTNPHRIPDRDFYAVPDAFRRAVARLVGAAPSDIAVADSTTFGIMLVVNGLDWRAGDQVLIAARGFPANRFPWHWLERRGVEVIEVPDDPEVPEVERFAAAMSPRTRVVSMEWVSYRTGLRRDLAAVGALCRDRGALFVVDGTQGVGGLHLDLAATPCDLLACSGYKWMLGPYGVGFAYLTAETAERLVPHNVNWFRIAGAEDFTRLADCELELVPGASRFDKNATASFLDLAGATAAADYLAEITMRAVEAHVRALLDRLLAGLPTGYRPAGSLRPERRSNILCLAAATFEETRRAHERLIAAGVVVSLRDAAIRVSPGIYNTEEEIDRLLELL